MAWQEKLATGDVWVQRTVMLTISHVYLVDQENNRVKDLIEVVRASCEIMCSDKNGWLCTTTEDASCVSQTHCDFFFRFFSTSSRELSTTVCAWNYIFVCHMSI